MVEIGRLLLKRLPPPPLLQDNFPKRRVAPLKENLGILKNFLGCCPTNARAERNNFGI